MSDGWAYGCEVPRAYAYRKSGPEKPAGDTVGKCRVQWSCVDAHPEIKAAVA